MPCLTIAGLFRNGRWQQATKRVNKDELITQREVAGVIKFLGDVGVADGLELPIVTVRKHGRPVRKIKLPPGARLPPGAKGTWHRSGLYEAVHDMKDAAVLGKAPAPEVTGVVIDKMREVFLHGLLVRILQALLLVFLGPHIDALLPHTVLAHRPVDGMRAGLLMARTLARRGYGWAVKLDIKSFYPSVKAYQVVNGLRGLLDIDDALLRVIVWTMSASINRNEKHKSVMSGAAATHEAALNALYQGAAIAPLLANVVGHAVFDGPFAMLMHGRAILLRYVDDMLILARDEATAREAFDIILKLAEVGNFPIHTDEDKTTAEPVDLTQKSIRVLGHELGPKGVHLLDAKFNKNLERLRQADPKNMKLSWPLFIDAVGSLFFDDLAAVDALVAACDAMSVEHGALIRKAHTHVHTNLSKRWFAEIQSFADPVLRVTP